MLLLEIVGGNPADGQRGWGRESLQLQGGSKPPQFLLTFENTMISAIYCEMGLLSIIE
jgi:hypothetical protein